MTDRVERAGFLGCLVVSLVTQITRADVTILVAGDYNCQPGQIRFGAVDGTVIPRGALVGELLSVNFDFQRELPFCVEYTDWFGAASCASSCWLAVEPVNGVRTAGFGAMNCVEHLANAAPYVGWGSPSQWAHGGPMGVGFGWGQRRWSMPSRQPIPIADARLVFAVSVPASATGGVGNILSVLVTLIGVDWRCPEDFNFDGVVDGSDLDRLLSVWGATPCWDARPDFNRDGSVDGADLGYLLANWGPCPN
jgi:hypothetical protein